MPEIVELYFINNFLPEKRLQFIAADEVFAKLDTDAHIAAIEQLLLAEEDWQEPSALKYKVANIYTDTLRTVLELSGIRVMASCVDLALLTNMLDALILAKHQYDVEWILGILTGDEAEPYLDKYCRLVVELTTEDDIYNVYNEIVVFNDDVITRLKEFIENTNQPDLDKSGSNAEIVERYKNWLKGRRYGIVYDYLTRSYNIGVYDCKDMYLMLEDMFLDAKDDDRAYEIVSLIVASNATDDEIPALIDYFAKVEKELPAEQNQYRTKLYKELGQQ